jgi:uncharacterized protein
MTTKHPAPAPDIEAEAALDERERRLREAIAGLPGAVVAFSAGVDSTLVAAVAHEVLGDRAVAVTGVSPSLAPREREEARALAARIGIRHEEIETHELERPGYVENSPERCFHCKDELFSLLTRLAEERAPSAVLDGCNLDDRGDFRPGRRAAREHGVRSPLEEAGLSKADVRALSHRRGLPTWDKPALACLASRIPYGTSVNVERLRQVANAEAALRDLGYRELRVRHHGPVARVELPAADLVALADEQSRAALVAAVKAAGFNYVALDLEGLRSGSMNEVLTPAVVALDRRDG